MPSSRPSFLRTSIGRAAVAGAATLVTITGFAPAATAADDLATESGAPDTTSESGSGSSSASAAAEQEAPAPQTEGENEQASPDPDGSEPVGGSDGSDTTPDDTTPTDGSEQPPAAADDQDDADGADETPEPSEAAAAAAPELTLASDSATVVSGRTVSVDVLGNDSSTEVLQSLTIDDQGEHGTAYVVGSRFEEPGQNVPGEGSLRIEFDAEEDYVGADSFTYRVTTQDGTTETATVAMDVEEYEAPPVEANFGTQKIRIGVQQADGSYLPEGTTTAGSVFRIEERPIGGGAPIVTTCTTLPTGGTSSQCPQFESDAGSTFVITQVSAPTGVVASPRRRVVDPCSGFFAGYCFDDTENVTFVNTGSVLPEANDDSAASRGGDSVDIDVLANDDSDDPGTTLEVDQQPRGGTAEVVGEADRPDEEVPGDVGIFAVPTAGSQVVRYTPEPGFEGIDDFTYRLTNGNGSDTATVTVAVSDNGAVTPVDPDDAGNASDGSVAGSGSGQVLRAAAGLPSAGGPDQGLLLLGGALLVGGAAAVAGTRRRRDVAGG